jgi:tRNA threonylcarbamoyladenosine biosynthesis protein TsaE
MVNYKKCLTLNPGQTKRTGRVLAREIIKSRPKKTAFVIALEGDLGSGKTTFLQGFARGLGIKEKILSPTFVLVKRFKIGGRRFNNFYHIDCYRIHKPAEIVSLNFKKIISEPRNIVAIEWAEKIRKILPKGATTLKFTFVDKSKRKIVLKSK